MLVPIMLNLTNKNVIIIGGGKIAERRITTLLNSNASITVISPQVTPKIKRYIENKKVKWVNRPFTPNDLHEAFLVVVATDDTVINELVVENAPTNALINVVEDAKQGNIQFPANFKRGKLTIAVSTDGASPILTKRIKDKLEAEYDENYEYYLDFLYEARALVKKSNLTKEEKREVLKELVTDNFFDEKKQQDWITSFANKGDLN